MSEMEETALDQRIRIDYRQARAKVITAHIMHIVGKYIPEDPDGQYEAAYRDLYEAMYTADAEIMSRTQIKELERFRDMSMFLSGP